MTDDLSDNDLERTFREGLRQAADRTEVGVPLVARAHAGARTRRRRRWAVVGTVAAVVAVSGTAFAVRSGDGSDRRPTDHAVTEPTTAAPVTAWRAESWHGLTVDVPADWGWGTAPTEMSFDRGTPLLCGGPGAMVRPDGTKDVNPKPNTAWVGRPVMLSDACTGQPFPTPEAPYVWLGADIEPGTVYVGNDYVQETVEAFGTTVTVASQDGAVREHVLGSARATSDCASHLDAPPTVLGILTEGLDPVHSAQVCAYQKAEARYDLVYAITLDEATAQELYSHGVGRGKASCDGGADEYVGVTFSGKDRMGTAELTQDWVVDPGCQAMSIGGDVWTPLTDEGMALWSRNGVQAVLRAFIGILG
jgi:hypothetical protein